MATHTHTKLSPTMSLFNTMNLTIYILLPSFLHPATDETLPHQMIVRLRGQLVALDRMRSRSDRLLHSLLNALETAANALECLSQARLDLIELLRDQREASQQIVQIVIDLRHPVGDHAHLALHIVHRCNGAVHVLFRLLLQPI